MFTVDYADPALNGSYNYPYITDGTFSIIGMRNYVPLNGQFNTGVFKGSCFVGEAANAPSGVAQCAQRAGIATITVGKTYTFGVAPLGFNSAPSFTMQVTAK